MGMQREDTNFEKAGIVAGIGAALPVVEVPILLGP
jgi:hypothetical protein